MLIGLKILVGGGCAAIADLGPERRLADPEEKEGGAGGEGGTGGAGGSAGGALGCSASSRVRWAAGFGDAFDDYAGPVASDLEGGVYVTGIFTGGIDFGEPLRSAGAEDLYLARLDAEGNHVWSRRFGDALGQTTVATLATMPDGGVLFARELVGAADFGDGPVGAVEGDGFVVRYAPDGTHLWTRMFGGLGQQNVWSVAVDPATGDVIAAGSFKVELEVGGQSLTLIGDSDMFVARLDPDDGSVKALHGYGGSTWDYVNAVAVDGAGRIYIGGESQSTFDLGGTLTAESDAYAFVAQLAPDGTPIWSRQFGGAGFQVVHHLALNPSGTELTTLTTLDGTADFGEGPITHQAGTVVTKLDVRGGSTLRSRGLDGLFSSRALVVDEADAVYLSGPFGRTIDLGAGAIPNAGAQDGLLLKLGATLTTEWSLAVSTPDVDNVWGIARDPNGDVFVQAYFHGQLELPGCEPIQSAGDADVVLLEIASP